jgi:hypothetical protein
MHIFDLRIIACPNGAGFFYFIGNKIRKRGGVL